MNMCKGINSDKQININMLSLWVKNIIEQHVSNKSINFITLPFPVDVNRYIPTTKENKYFIYFKDRHSSYYDQIITMINKFKLDYEMKVFVYGTYKDQEFLEYIGKSKFGIWIGRHESQGFALEEALSSDCPLFICDVISMKDQYNKNKPSYNNISYDLPATSAPYFDDTCGMIHKNGSDIEQDFKDFLSKLSQYNPRQYVLNNLSTKQFINNINKLFNL
jgi:hypothetical protein